MLRLVYMTIFLGMVLTAWVCVNTAWADSGAAAENKQIYSNRPAGYTVPTPYYGTPMAPRFIVPPNHSYRVQAVRYSAGETETAAKVIESDVPLAPPQIVERTIILRDPQPEINVNDELDTFYARLAKIQLEKHHITETLALVQKIKSEMFKVRTVVSLAEYVSRDKNYQSEAEQLYHLAIAGMEALDQKQPFRVDLDSVKDIAQPVIQLPPVRLPSQESVESDDSMNPVSPGGDILSLPIDTLQNGLVPTPDDSLPPIVRPPRIPLEDDPKSQESGLPAVPPLPPVMGQPPQQQPAGGGTGTTRRTPRPISPLPLEN